MAAIECLRCGCQRDDVAGECPCPRCGYIGWAPSEALDEALRRRLRELPPSTRRLPRVSLAARR